MQSKEEIFGWVAEVLMHEFEFSVDELDPATHLIDDLDLDSIDAVDMAVRLEEKTGYRFAEEELRSVTTIQDVGELTDGHQ